MKYLSTVCCGRLVWACLLTRQHLIFLLCHRYEVLLSQTKGIIQIEEVLSLNADIVIMRKSYPNGFRKSLHKHGVKHSIELVGRNPYPAVMPPWRRLTVFDPSWGQLPPSPSGSFSSSAAKSSHSHHWLPLVFSMMLWLDPGPHAQPLCYKFVASGRSY